MKAGYLLIVTFVALSLFSVALGDGDVVVLSDNNFDLTANGAWLVEFYAPWCGHCKKLAPIFEEVATKVKGTINVAKVDCTIEKGLQDRFAIKGYPTIKFFKDGQMYEYNDQRTLDAFVTFAEGGYATTTSKPIPAAKVAQVNEPAEKKEVPEPQPVPVAATQDGSDVVVLTKSNFDTLTAKGAWLLEFYAPWCGHCKSLVPTYEKLATATKGKFNIAKIDCTQEDSLRARFDIKGFPTIKFLKNGKLYDYKGARTLEAFTAFLESGYTEASSIDYKAPTASTETASDVVVLTDSNFDEKTAKGNWLVEFYAPWCGHCKMLAPIYEQVATALKGTVNVAKVDCTAEKGVCSQYEIGGYPTVQYLRNGQRYTYQSDRTVAAFTEFAKTGWEKVQGEPLPPPRSFIKQKLVDFFGAVESLLRMNIYIVVAVCVGVGLFFGIVIIVLTAPKAAPPPHPQQQQQQPQQQTNTPTNDEGENTKKDK